MKGLWELRKVQRMVDLGAHVLQFVGCLAWQRTLVLCLSQLLIGAWRCECSVRRLVPCCCCCCCVFIFERALRVADALAIF